MSDYKDLRTALRAMEAAEGRDAKEALIRASNQAALDDRASELVDRLRTQIKARAPRVKVGPVLATEILASVGRFLDERDA